MILFLIINWVGNNIAILPALILDSLFLSQFLGISTFLKISELLNTLCLWHKGLFIALEHSNLFPVTGIDISLIVHKISLDHYKFIKWLDWRTPSIVFPFFLAQHPRDHRLRILTRTQQELLSLRKIHLLFRVHPHQQYLWWIASSSLKESL